MLSLLAAEAAVISNNLSHGKRFSHRTAGNRNTFTSILNDTCYRIFFKIYLDNYL